MRKFDWANWAKGSAKATCLDVADIVINPRFWLAVDEILKASEPILKVLRIVDADTKPNMAYLHGAFIEARKAIINNFEGDELTYSPILSIMDKRWDKHYQAPLVKAAFFLNPGFYHKLSRYRY